MNRALEVLAPDPTTLREAVARVGVAVVRWPEAIDRVGADPWSFTSSVWGEAARMVERQPLRPIAGARSFAASNDDTPLHTDSQDHLGAPPHLQILVCERPAADGGTSLFVDTWGLLERLQRDDPGLFDALFDVHRHFGFVFGDVHGPTVRCVHGSLAFTHPPFVDERDGVARALRPHIDAAPRIEHRLAAGEVLVSDNHRMLHGRTRFEDAGRRLVRVLAWLRGPVSVRPELLDRARRVECEASDPTAEQRMAIVLEMLRGTAPGILAQRAGVAEPVLYRWRNAFLRGGLDALLRA